MVRRVEAVNTRPAEWLAHQVPYRGVAEAISSTPYPFYIATSKGGRAGGLKPFVCAFGQSPSVAAAHKCPPLPPTLVYCCHWLMAPTLFFQQNLNGYATLTKPPPTQPTCSGP